MLGQISSKPGVLPMLGQIPSKPWVSPVLGQISGQRRSFASARANSRPGGGATPVLGQISGQRLRGFASARAKFRARARAKGSRIMESYVPSELLPSSPSSCTRKDAILLADTSSSCHISAQLPGVNSFSHAIGFCFDERSAALLSHRMRRSHRTTPL